MLKKIISISIIFCSVISMNVKAGVPVVDAGSIAQAVIQVQEAKKRYETLRQQFQAATGNARLGVLTSDPAVAKTLNKYLPDGYSNVSQAVKNGDVGALKTLLDNVKANEASMQGKGKERLAATFLVNQAQLDGLLKTLNARNNKIDGIVSQINSTTDLSSKADLANTLAGEQAQVNTEMNKMSVLMKQMEIQERIAQRQAMTESKSQLMGSRP